MRFVSSHELNQNKWNSLVRKAGGNFFSLSFFLEATAKSWGAYVDEAYTKGFAVCYNRVFGVRMLYPPIFGRTVDFLNLSEKERESAFKQVQRDFRVGILQSEQQIGKGPFKTKNYQLHDPGNKRNALAGRMIRKAEKGGLIIQPCDFRLILPFIRSELGEKVKELSPQNLSRLEKLLSALEQENSLLSYGIFNAEKQLSGGQFFALNGDRMNYILGSAVKSVREAGGMYLCMSEAIRESLEQGKTLDFGGSNIPSIRRFYIGLGGTDRQYYAYSWDRAPFLFRLIRKIKKKFGIL